MIGEWRVHAGDFDLGHVACDAVLCADRARVARMILQPLAFLCVVTRQTFLIVRASVFYQLLVRVVAGDAGQAGFALVPAFAVFQAIGLEADVGDAGCACLKHVCPRAMASTTEVYRGYGI